MVTTREPAGLFCNGRLSIFHCIFYWMQNVSGVQAVVCFGPKGRQTQVDDIGALFSKNAGEMMEGGGLEDGRAGVKAEVAWAD